jgi:hypothetical protein
MLGGAVLGLSTRSTTAAPTSGSGLKPISQAALQGPDRHDGPRTDRPDRPGDKTLNSDCRPDTVRTQPVDASEKSRGCARLNHEPMLNSRYPT